MPVPGPSTSSRRGGLPGARPTGTQGGVTLPPLKELGLPTITSPTGGSRSMGGSPFRHGPRPGEGDHRWLTGSEIESATSSLSVGRGSTSTSRSTHLTRETPGLRGRPPGERIPTQSRDQTRSGVAVVDPRSQTQRGRRRDDTESSEEDSSTEEGDDDDDAMEVDE